MYQSLIVLVVYLSHHAPTHVILGSVENNFVFLLFYYYYLYDIRRRGHPD